MPSLLAEWAGLIDEFPTRVLIGSDKVGHWTGYADIIRSYDALLDELSPKTAALVAGGNAARIFVHK